MVAAHESPARPKIKKRKYSRKGCQECKRRKIKCDEAFPACYNCSRLNKPCTYLGDTPVDEIEENLGIGHGIQIARGIRPHISENLPHTHGTPLMVKFYEPKGADSVVRPRNGSSSHASTQNGSPLGDPSRTGVGLPGIGTLPDLNTGSGLLRKLDAASTSPSLSQPLGSLDLLNFLPLDMQNFLANVNVFLDDFYLNHTADMGDASGFGELPVELLAQAPKTPVTPSMEPKLNNLPDEPMPELRVLDFSLSPGCIMEVGGIHEHLMLLNSELTEQCIQKNDLREPHIYYLRLLSTTDLLFHLFPFAPLVESNGVVRLLLTYLVDCTFLLTSLLAILATFQFIRTSEKRHDAALLFYIDVCFRALSEAFKKHHYYENSAIFASSIEKLLLTVLIVSTRFTATTTLLDAHAPSTWKDHLKGARDLLVNYSLMTRLSLRSRLPYMLSGLALAKCWFFAIEASAAMHTSVGGALSRAQVWQGESGLLPMPDLYLYAPAVDLDTEYQTFVDTGCIEPCVHPEYHHALLRVQLVHDIDEDSVFNLYWGFNLSFLRPVLAFVSFTDAVKRRGLAHVPFKWTMHLLGLLDSLLQERVVPGVCLHTFEIPRSSIAHPEYEGENRLRLPESCYATKRDEQGNLVYFSWFDASHQFHGDYLSLRVMVSQNFLALPRSHPDVQYLIRKFFDGAFFIKSKKSAQYEQERHHVVTDSSNYYLSTNLFDIRCVMVQSMFRLVSGIVVEEDHFEKIELYFMGVLKLGNGSLLKSLDMVARIRLLRAENAVELGDAPDERIYDFYDSMNDIPFS